METKVQINGSVESSNPTPENNITEKNASSECNVIKILTAEDSDASHIQPSIQEQKLHTIVPQNDQYDPESIDRYPKFI